MAALSETEASDIVAPLRAGLVPRRGLHHFAVGLDRLMEAVEDELERVATGGGRGVAKWIRGEYGSGKTFATRLLRARARGRGFATSEVQISINDTPLHHLETVYRRLMERLTTPAEGEGALKAVVDAWLYELGEEVIRLKGLDEDDPEFADAVEARLEDKLAELSASNPAFAQVLRTYHRAQLEGDFGLAQGLLGWLAGQPNIARKITSQAGVKGSVDGQAALAFLRGLLLLLRQSGHRGLVVVLDEVETIQRMPSQTREKSLNALRQLMDSLANDELPGMYLVVTGTPDFFEGHRGLKSLAPLYQRVSTRFDADPQFDNLRAPQVRLTPFDVDRLVSVGLRVREIYPAKHPERVARIDDAMVRALVDKVTTAFGGRVEVGPRLFLRELVDLLDRCDQHPDYDPATTYDLQIDESTLQPAELDAYRRTTGDAAEAVDAADEPSPRKRRLDG